MAHSALVFYALPFALCSLRLLNSALRLENIPALPIPYSAIRIRLIPQSAFPIGLRTPHSESSFDIIDLRATAIVFNYP